jgi:hypothetical protein
VQAVPQEQAARLGKLQGQATARDWQGVGALAQAELTVPNQADVPELTAALAGVRDQGRHLDALTRLRNTVAGDWAKPPDPDAVESALNDLSAGADTEALRSDVRTYLACRARLEGRNALAARLRPAIATAKAPEVLRDLKVLGAALDVPGAPPEAPADPLLGPLPQPEAPAMSLRAPVRESLGAGLPEAEELPKAERAARKSVLRRIEANAHLPWHCLNLHLLRLKDFRPAVKEDENEAKKDATAEEDVVRLLRRELKPEERILVRHLRRTKTSEEIKDILEK